MLFPMTALLIGDSEFLRKIKVVKKVRLFNRCSKYTFAHQAIRMGGKQVFNGSQNDALCRCSSKCLCPGVNSVPFNLNAFPIGSLPTF